MVETQLSLSKDPLSGITGEMVMLRTDATIKALRAILWTGFSGQRQQSSVNRGEQP